MMYCVFRYAPVGRVSVFTQPAYLLNKFPAGQISLKSFSNPDERAPSTFSTRSQNDKIHLKELDLCRWLRRQDSVTSY